MNNNRQMKTMIKEERITPLRDGLNPDTVMDAIFIKTNSENPASTAIHGDCIIVSEHNGLDGAARETYCNILIDFGYDISAKDILRVCSERNITSFQYVIISHYHEDHITPAFNSNDNAYLTANPIKSLISGYQDDNGISYNGLSLSGCTFILPHPGYEFSNWIPPADDREGDDPNLLKDRRDRIEDYLNTLEQPFGVRILDSNNYGNVICPHGNSQDLIIRLHNYDNFDSSYLNWTTSVQNLSDYGTQYNAFSLMTVIEHYGHKCVFTGDMVKPAQRACAEYVRNCDVYKVEHHGLEFHADDLWLNNMKPQYAVICQFQSRKIDNAEGTNRKTVQCLAAKGTQILTTGDKNEITIRSTKEKLDAIEAEIYRYPVGSCYVNNTYRSFVASMNGLLSYPTNPDDPKDESPGRVDRLFSHGSLGGYSKIGSLVFVQLKVKAKKALSYSTTDRTWDILTGFPAPKFHAIMSAVVLKGNMATPKPTTQTINAYIWYSEKYQSGVLKINIPNSSSNIAVGDWICVTGAYVCCENEWDDDLN